MTKMKTIKILFTSIVLLIQLQFAISQTDSLKIISIGDHFQGGIVFFIDETGNHGLIAVPNDQTTEKVMWGHNGNTNALSPDDGNYNTKKILEYFQNNYLSAEKSAAYLCSSLEIEAYKDWYLPSINELRLMHENRNKIGGFMLGDYCSSSEYSSKDVYSVHFRPHRRVEFHYNKVDKDYFVRCIRKF